VPDWFAQEHSRRVPVLGTHLHVVDAGEGPAVLFLHGNPTSSFLWRHVLARRDPGRRCVAVDLVGMGGSGKPDAGYGLADHIAHVDALVEALDLDRYVVVAHDWGVAIGFDRLRRFPAQVHGIAFCEAHLRPLTGWDEFDPGGRDLFRRLRTDGEGERMVLEDNFFVDTLLPAALRRGLTEEEFDAYRSPYPDAASRRPLLRWPREIPIGGEPPGVVATMQAGWDHLRASDVPKLLLHGDPGSIVTAPVVRRCRDELGELTVADVGGPAGHFLPEDRPDAVADALWAWLARVR
jgi:haloalkane dehalogenase